MKKLYLLLLSLLTAVGAYADRYELWGSFNNWAAGIIFDQVGTQYEIPDLRAREAANCTFAEFEVRIYTDYTTQPREIWGANGTNLLTPDNNNWYQTAKVASNTPKSSPIKTSGFIDQYQENGTAMGNSYKIIYNANHQIKAVKDKSGFAYGTMALPEILYLAGNFDGNGWKWRKTCEDQTDEDKELGRSRYRVEVPAETDAFFILSSDGTKTSFDDQTGNGSLFAANYNDKNMYNSTQVLLHQNNTQNVLKIPAYKNKCTYEIRVFHYQGTVGMVRLSETGEEIEIGVGAGFYFYGDMNRWSSNDLDGKKIEESDIGVKPSLIWENDEYFLSKEEIAQYWQFVSCTLPKNITVKDNNGNKDDGKNWFMLDFADLQDEYGHTGRLCGQFKITAGNKGDEANLGVRDPGNSLGYLIEKKISPISEEENVELILDELFKPDHGSGLGNIQLGCNYVENAKIYLKVPDDRTNGTYYMIITGEPKYIYAYYTYIGKERLRAPETTHLTYYDQLNYFINYHGWNDADLGSAAGFNPDNVYNWELLEDDDIPEYRGRKLEGAKKVWRKLIPYTATHRFPVELSTTVSREDGSLFPYQRIECEDQWFIESDPVDIYFRYEDGHEPDWVRYNTYIEQLDHNNGTTIGRQWYTNESTGLISNGESAYPTQWCAMRRVTDENDVVWFKSTSTVSGTYAGGSNVIFQTSEPFLYPEGGVLASETAQDDAFLNGEDLFYVVPSGRDRIENPRVELLYSHLKGTYSIQLAKAGEDLQINAEYFRDGVLDTSYRGNVTYSFAIYKAGIYIDGTQPENMRLDPLLQRSFNVTEIPGDHSTNKYAPFYDIPASFFTQHGAGWYRVRVQVRRENVTYTAYDVIPVFPTLDDYTDQYGSNN